MPYYKDTSAFYEHGLGDIQNALGQYSIGTGRTANPDMMYKYSQGMLSPLLEYDLARRKMAEQAWIAQHERRRSQPSGLERWTKGILGGAYLASAALGNPLGITQGANMISGATSKPPANNPAINPQTPTDESAVNPYAPAGIWSLINQWGR